MTTIRKHLIQDLMIVIGSIAIAIILVRSGIVDHAVAALHQFSLLGIIAAGTLFTSIFTTAPAIAVLGELSQSYPPPVVALLGATGSIIGDLIIFKFVKDRFSEDLKAILHNRKPSERFQKLVKLKFFRWILFFVGGMIIASPLPDELGISLLGLSRMKTSWFIPIAFTFNFIGILLISLIAQSA